MIQKYECEICGVESHVTFEDGADFYTVFKALLDDHRKWSPECDADIYSIKVFRQPEDSPDSNFAKECEKAVDSRLSMGLCEDPE